MARRPRRELPTNLLHVTCRTVRRTPLFLSERDASALLDLLDHASCDVAPWTLYAYCLMPNHVHYVVHAKTDDLARIMWRVNGLYAQRFNREHGFSGHLFQGRYHATPILGDAHLCRSIRYVVLNPVRGGLCERPEQWRWSSYRPTLGLSAARRCLAADETLELFGADRAMARTHFRRFVEDALPRAEQDEVRGQAPGLSPLELAS